MLLSCWISDVSAGVCVSAWKKGVKKFHNQPKLLAFLCWCCWLPLTFQWKITAKVNHPVLTQWIKRMRYFFSSSLSMSLSFSWTKYALPHSFYGFFLYPPLMMRKCKKPNVHKDKKRQKMCVLKCRKKQIDGIGPYFVVSTT